VALLIDGVGRALFPNARTLAFGVLILSITLTGWVQYARTVRGSTMVERNKEYVQAARVTGVAPLRIMRAMCCPTCWAGAGAGHHPGGHGHHHRGHAVLPGRGRAAHQPSLGTLIRVGNDFLFSGEWWITIFPGADAGLIALSVNLLGDWLRDALNPRLKCACRLLEVKNLVVEFPTRRGTLRALDDISFDIAPGEILGVVGESGAASR
jgi:peptide/nickel transport system permease protein